MATHSHHGKRRLLDDPQLPEQRGSKSTKTRPEDPATFFDEYGDSESTFAPVILAESTKGVATFAEAVGKFLAAEKQKIDEISSGDSLHSGGSILHDAYIYWNDSIYEYNILLEHDDDQERKETMDGIIFMYYILLESETNRKTEKGKETTMDQIMAIREYFAVKDNRVAIADMSKAGLTPQNTKKLLIALHTVLRYRIDSMKAPHYDIPEIIIERYERTQDRLLDFMADSSCGVITPDAYNNFKLVKDNYSALQNDGY